LRALEERVRELEARIERLEAERDARREWVARMAQRVRSLAQRKLPRGILTIWQRRDKARQVAAKIQIAILKHTLEEFYIDTGTYPSGEEGLRALVEKPSDPDGAPSWNGPYLDVIPKDPWGGEYVYRRPGAEGADFDIICYGKDGVEGGEGVNRDITNHNLHDI
jgi:general secretion pathway protein G